MSERIIKFSTILVNNYKTQSLQMQMKTFFLLIFVFLYLPTIMWSKPKRYFCLFSVFIQYKFSYFCLFSVFIQYKFSFLHLILMQCQNQSITSNRNFYLYAPEISPASQPQITVNERIYHKWITPNGKLHLLGQNKPNIDHRRCLCLGAQERRFH